MCAEQRNSRVFDAHLGGHETTQNLTVIYTWPTTKIVLGEDSYHHMCTQHRGRGNTPIHSTATSIPGRHSPPNSAQPRLEDRLITSVNFETHPVAHFPPLRIFIAPCESFPSIWDWVTPDADERSTPAEIPAQLPLHRSMGLVAALIMFRNVSSGHLAKTRRLSTCFRTGWNQCQRSPGRLP
ncbi:hypothetical protein J3458_019935 [Metarhizium acridum]|uniref:uncharacterized protein n=1 Tax=Metarhizium acridum TaxID=92637 RepID=UPI001C6B23C9|nr:hypothetical protein J3458_019935 [Metarhizium acridum]